MFLRKYAYLIILILTMPLIVAVCILTTPIMLCSRKRGVYIMSFISLYLWTILGIIFFESNSVQYDITGLKEVYQGENCIVISNHISACDFVVINEITKHFGMLQHSKYLIKESLKYVFPLNYMYFLGFIWAKREFDKDRKSILKTLSFLNEQQIPYNIVMFPEGTRFTAKKKKASDAFCESRGITRYRHVLCPRTKGFELICQSLKGKIQHIVDITLISLTQPAQSFFQAIFLHARAKYICRVVVYSIDEAADARKFMMHLFAEKDCYINKYANYNE